jgi:hypothetical protein
MTNRVLKHLIGDAVSFDGQRDKVWIHTLGHTHNGCESYVDWRGTCYTCVKLYFIVVYICECVRHVTDRIIILFRGHNNIICVHWRTFIAYHSDGVSAQLLHLYRMRNVVFTRNAKSALRLWRFPGFKIL